MVNNCEEKWIPVDGYDGKYEVSSLGRVRSFARKSYNGKLLVQREQNGLMEDAAVLIEELSARNGGGSK